MKHNHVFLIVYSLLIACNNNKAAQDVTATNVMHQPEVASKKEIMQTSGDAIVGYWKLTLEAYDDNGNKTLDEQEIKKGIKNKYTYRFNADGSCQIQEFYKGRYEVETEGGNKMLYVYRNRIVGEEDEDPPPDVYRIINESKNQLFYWKTKASWSFGFLKEPVKKFIGDKLCFRSPVLHIYL